MINSAIKAQLREAFNEMQETAFSDPILLADNVDSAIKTDKFTRRIKFTENWLISICLTISPEDDDKNHFWHASLTYISKLTGKAKSRFLWNSKEINIAKEILLLVLEEVGLTEENIANPITFHSLKIAQHAHKNLSDIERSVITGEAEKCH